MVTGLNSDIIVDDVRSIFERVGKVRDAAVQYDQNGNSLGSALVTYSSAQDARKAAEEFDGARVDSKEIRVQLIVSAEESSGDSQLNAQEDSTPTSYGGRGRRGRGGRGRGGRGRGRGGRGRGRGFRNNNTDNDDAAEDVHPLMRGDATESITEFDASFGEDDRATKSSIFGSALRDGSSGGNGRRGRGRRRGRGGRRGGRGGGRGGGRKNADAADVSMTAEELDAQMDNYHSNA